MIIGLVGSGTNMTLVTYGTFIHRISFPFDEKLEFSRPRWIITFVK